MARDEAGHGMFSLDVAGEVLEEVLKLTHTGHGQTWEGLRGADDQEQVPE